VVDGENIKAAYTGLFNSGEISGKRYFTIITNRNATGAGHLVSSHFRATSSAGGEKTTGFAYMAGSNRNNLFVCLDDQTIETGADANAWFKAQYDAGTPCEFVISVVPIETDISDLISDEFIKVEGNGTIRALNEHKQAVPSTIKYTVKVGN